MVATSHLWYWSLKMWLVLISLCFVVVRCCSVAKSYPTLCNSMDWSMPCFPVLYCLPEVAHTHVHGISDAIHPTISSSVTPFSFCPQSFPAFGSFTVSQLLASGVFAKYWSFSFSSSSSFEYSGLISFRIDWFDILAVQGPLKSFLQQHSLKPSNSSVLSLLCGLILTSVHDYWKNHSFDYIDLSWQSDVFAF